MSAFGTKRTSRRAQSMSAFGGKAGIHRETPRIIQSVPPCALGLGYWRAVIGPRRCRNKRKRPRLRSRSWSTLNLVQRWCEAPSSPSLQAQKLGDAGLGDEGKEAEEIFGDRAEFQFMASAKGPTSEFGTKQTSQSSFS
jgi:hypothetical protein